MDSQILLEHGTEASDNDLLEITQNFAFAFQNAGYMKDGEVVTLKVTPKEEPPILLSEIVQKGVDESYYIKQEDMAS